MQAQLAQPGRSPSSQPWVLLPLFRMLRMQWRWLFERAAAPANTAGYCAGSAAAGWRT
jgi:hypothetical protein